MKKTTLIILIVICFFISARVQAIQVISPNGGENWQQNTVHPITWTAAGITQKVKLILFKDGARVGLIADNLDAAAPFAWTVGKNSNGTAAVGGGYTICVRTMDNSRDDFSDAPFAIGNPSQVVVIGRKRPELPPTLLKFPRLEVSNIDLTPNVEGFGIVFSYKNVGNGPLPKASEVPVKPSYRVLVDGLEMAKGYLVIPTFPAPPGWEQTGYFGGWIIQPTGVNDYSWHIGNTVTVHINENKVMGMDSHSLSLNLKTIALKYGYDLICNSVVYNWDTNQLAMSVRIDGDFTPNKKLEFFCSGEFHVDMELKPGQRLYSISHKLASSVPRDRKWIVLRAGALLDPVPYGSSKKIMDIDLRNNFGEYRFTRPPK